MYKTVALLHSERAGFFAACLYNASFYAGVTAGIYLMPDAPQMVFWTFSLWMIARITKDENDWRSWVLFGIAAGLCIMSKVHGVFLWGGMGLYMLFLKRSLFFKSQFYVAALLTLAITSPDIDLEH
jgi:4-amino-4-deoxy-L-arabinose transferase-like glycosyltransferase